MACGRESGGSKIDDLGVCPASAYNPERDGINQGESAGRVCWTLEGTLCEGHNRGEKFKHCIRCPFFTYVSNQEGRDFNLGMDLIKKKPSS